MTNKKIGWFFRIAVLAGVILFLASSGSFAFDADKMALHVKAAKPKIANDVTQMIEKQRPAARSVVAVFGAVNWITNRTTVVLELQEGANISNFQLAGYGGYIKRRYKNLVKVNIPVTKIEALANAMPQVRFVRRPDKPIPLAVSEGVNLTGTSGFQSAGYKGKDIKVAVIDLGFVGLSSAKANGELPASVIAQDYTGQGIESGTSHGTAVAEIVYDMAPEAKLYLIKIDDSIDLGAAETYCKQQGIKIVNHSVGWFNTGAGNGTGVVCDIATDAKNNGILWVNAAGNETEKHWQGMFTTTLPDGTYQAPDGHTYRIHEFVTGNEDSNSLAITAGAGETIQLYMRWNDWPVTSRSYFLSLYDKDPVTDDTAEIVVSAGAIQNGTLPPLINLTYISPTAKTYYLIVVSVDVNPSNNVEIEIFSASHNLEYKTAASSLMEPADAASVLTAGAVSKNNWTNGPIEYFSSQGPTNGWAGSAERIKPDISGPDGVTNFTVNPFYGTSASSPHVAGAAAALLSLQPNMTVDQLRAELEAKAGDLGTGGKDNIYGAGKLNLPAPSTYLSNVVINEFVPNPDGSNSEWVELYNKGSQAVNIGGCWLDDSTTGGSAAQQIPDGIIIQPSGFYVHTLDAGDGFLNNTSDEINFLAPDKTTVIETKSFGSSLSYSDQSIYRFPDGGAWQSGFDNSPTKGAANDGPSVSLGSLKFTVKDKNNSLAPDVLIILYDSNYSKLSEATTASDATYTFTNLAAGTYNYEVYYPSSSPDTRSFWVSGSAVVSSGQTTDKAVTQINPYITNVTVKDGNGQPKSTFNNGDAIRVSVEVKNSEGVLRNVYPNLYLDGDKQAPYYGQFSKLNEARDLAAGSTTTFDFDFTVPADLEAGTMYINAEVNSKYGTAYSRTDLGNWNWLFQIEAAVNQPPVVLQIPDQVFDEDATKTINLDGYVSDPDNVDSEITWTASGNTNIAVTINPQTRVATFTPASNWNGSENITFTAKDPGNLSGSKTFKATINPVNDAPTIAGIPNQQGTEDVSWTLDLNLYINDIETPKSSLVITENSAYASVNEQIITFNYPDGITTQQVTITVSDGQLSASQTITVDIAPVNDTPSISGVVTVEETGALIPDAVVHIYKRNELNGATQGYGTVITGQDGAFIKQDLVAGEYCIYVTKPGYGLNLKEGIKLLEGQQLTVQNLTMTNNPGKIAGLATDGTNPLAGISIRLKTIALTQRRFVGDISVLTDANGNYLIGGLGPHLIYEIDVSSATVNNQDYAMTGTKKDIIVANGAETKVDLALVKATAVSGAVKSPSGEPMVGAEVWLANEHSIFYSVITDQQGNYQFRNIKPGIYYFVAKPQAGASYALTDIKETINNISSSHTNSDIVLNEGGITISGKVTVQDTGQPIEGLRMTYRKEEIRAWIGATTNALGEYSIMNMPKGEASILAQPGAVYAAESITMNFQADTANINFSLGKTGRIKGVALKKDTGQLFGRIETNFWNDSVKVAGNYCYTDTSGNFDINETLVTGIASLKLRPDPSTGYSWSMPSPCDSVYVTPGQTLLGINRYSKKGALVRGVVKDSSGSPVGDIQIIAKGKNTGVWYFTDSLGKFEMRLPEGKTVLGLGNYPSYCGLNKIIDISDVNQDIDLPQFTVYTQDSGVKISGNVVNPGSYSKAGNFWVVAYPAGFLLNEETVYALSNFVAYKELKTASQYELGALPPDNNYDMYLTMYKLSENSAYCVVIRDVEFNVPGGWASPLDLHYNSEGGTISGRIVDQDGTPVLGAFAGLKDVITDKYRGAATTDQNGNYMFYNVAAGDYNIRGIHSLYVTSTIVSVTVTESGAANAGDVVISPSFFPPQITPSVPSIVTDEDAIKVYDLTQYEKDLVDSDAQLTWSVSGVDTNLFTAGINAVTDELTITPVADKNGSDTITLTLTNSHGLTAAQDVTITVNPVNDSPTIAGIPDQQLTEDVALTLDVSGYINDIDNDKSTLTITENSNYAAVNGQKITFNYPNGITSEQVTITVSDGQLSASQAITINITAVNDPPVFMAVSDKITDEGQEAAFTVNASDIDSANLVYSASNLPAGATFDPATRAFKWTPSFTQGRPEQYTVTFTVSDGQASASINVKIKVNNVEQPHSIPVVTVISPAAGSQVSGIIQVAASITNTSGLEGVYAYLYVDSSSIGLDVSAPYTFSWNTTNSANGSHAIFVKVSYTYYESDILKTGWVQSAVVNVTVNNPVISVAITSPANGSAVNGIVNIGATAPGASFVYYYIDGVWKGQSFSPFNYAWDTAATYNGTHTIFAKAFYSATVQWVTSGTITVTVNNAVPPNIPTINITSPTEGQTVSGIATITAEVANATASGVYFYINNKYKYYDSASPYQYLWNTATYTDGNHTIKVTAYIPATRKYITRTAVVRVDN